MAWRWRRHALSEIGYALSRRAYAREARTLVPGLLRRRPRAGLRRHPRPGARARRHAARRLRVLRLRRRPARPQRARRRPPRPRWRSPARSPTARASERAAPAPYPRRRCGSWSPARAAPSVRRWRPRWRPPGTRCARSPATPRACAATGIDEIVTGDALTGAGLERGGRGRGRRLLPHPLDGARRRRAPGRSPTASACRRRTSSPPAGARACGASSTSAASSRRAALRRPTCRAGWRVEDSLLDAAPEAVALRASIVISAASRSFRFLVRLVERSPVLPLPVVA